VSHAAPIAAILLTTHLGTKPIHFDSWFDIVHKQHRSFVANTIGHRKGISRS
jgi:hypothetical protein